MQKIEITYLGTFWGRSGTLYTMSHPDGHTQARVYVDSIGETWVDIRRIPEGGYFHTERVEAYRALNGATVAEQELRDRGFTEKRIDPNAHRVEERGI